MANQSIMRMAGNRAEDLGDGIASGDAINLGQLNAAVSAGTYWDLTGSVLSPKLGSYVIDAGGQKITGGAAATLSTDFVIKSQLDAVGVQPTNQVLVGTGTGLTSYSDFKYTSGSSKLSIGGLTASSLIELFNSGTGTATGSDGLTLLLAGTAAYIWNRENNFLSLGAGNAARLNISSTGVLDFKAYTANEGSASIDGVAYFESGSGILKRSSLADLKADLNINESLWTNSGANTYLTETTDNVGIGVTAPETSLHVAGAITAGTQASSTSGADILYGRYSSPANGNVAVFGSTLSSGAPFIGYAVRAEGMTTATDYRSATPLAFRRSVLEVGQDLMFKYADAQTPAIGAPVTGLTDVFIVKGVEKRVGINTSPSYALDVSTASNTGMRFKGTTASGVNIVAFYNDSDKGLTMIPYGSTYAAGSIFNVGANGLALYSNTRLGFGTQTAHDLSLHTSNITRVYITSTGDVGIGTTSPSYKLDVAGTIFGIQGIFKANGENTILRATGLGNAANVWLRFQDNGNTNIGYLGYGSGSNSDIQLSNSIGAVKLMGSGGSVITANTDRTVTFDAYTTDESSPSIVSLPYFEAGSGLIKRAILADLKTALNITNSPWSTDTNGITYSSGNVGNGIGSQADSRFYNYWATSSSSSRYGLWNFISNSSTGAARGLYSYASSLSTGDAWAGEFVAHNGSSGGGLYGVAAKLTGDGSGTSVVGVGIFVQSPTLTGGHLLTTNYGAYISNQKVAGVGTPFGLYIAEQTVGASGFKYNLYSSGATSINVLNGWTSMGHSSTPLATVDIRNTTDHALSVEGADVFNKDNFRLSTGAFSSSTAIMQVQGYAGVYADTTKIATIFLGGVSTNRQVDVQRTATLNIYAPLKDRWGTMAQGEKLAVEYAASFKIGTTTHTKIRFEVASGVSAVSDLIFVLIGADGSGNPFMCHILHSFNSVSTNTANFITGSIQPPNITLNTGVAGSVRYFSLDLSAGNWSDTQFVVHCYKGGRGTVNPVKPVLSTLA